jgi:zinc-finger of transposase IS204/IS1001/IS1096/IS1165/Helix-turn-helix domain of transposase family ISL3
VAVDRVEVDDEGGRMVHLRTTDPTAAACPQCGVFSTSVRQRRTTRPKDLPYGEAPLAVCWHKQQFACRERSCPRTAFTEWIAELPPYARITGRTRRAAGASIGTGRSVRAVCAELPMSWPTAHAAFVDHAERLLTEPAAPQVLGIDETRRGRPRWSRNDDGSWRRLERFETNFVDLSGSGGLLGQTAGRTAKSVVAWLVGRTGRPTSSSWRSIPVPPTGLRSSTLCRRPGSSPITSTSTGSPGRWSPTSASASSGSMLGAAAVPPIPRGPTDGCCCAPASGSRPGARPAQGQPPSCRSFHASPRRAPLELPAAAQPNAEVLVFKYASST